MVFHCRLHTPRKECFKVSHLFYAGITQPQYQAVVKLLGSFRLTTGNRHLHRYCIFTEQILETVFQSLRHSCTSELTRQGITLYYSSQQDHIFTPYKGGTTYGLSFESWIQQTFRFEEVAIYDVSLSTLFTVSYNRPNPFRIRLLRYGTLGRL